MGQRHRSLAPSEYLNNAEQLQMRVRDHPQYSLHNKLVTPWDVEVQFLCQAEQEFEPGTFTLKSHRSRFLLARNSTSEVL